MSSPGCECGGSALPASHCSSITSTPSALPGTVVRTVKPGGVSGTVTWCFQMPMVAEVIATLDIDDVLHDFFEKSSPSMGRGVAVAENGRPHDVAGRGRCPGPIL